MLTGFKNRAVQQKTSEELKKTEQLHHFMRQLLKEALQQVIVEDNFRVHIEGEPYRVEFKFPDKETLQSIKNLFDNNRLVPFKNKLLGAEILVHSFKISPQLLQIVEVLYRPISRPRL